MRNAREILDEAVAKRAASAQRMIEQVMTVVPDDAIVKASALKFEIATGDKLAVDVGDKHMSLHNHALRQVGERASVPAAYIDKLVTGAVWQQDLLAEILNRTYGHSPGRHLVRSVGSEIRGFLSDRFRRLDCRPLLEEFIKGVSAYGATPIGGTATDIMVALKVVLPDPIEIWPGEWVVMGSEISNSDYGGARFAIRSLILRVVCLNGATAEDVMQRVHLGGKLSDDVVFSRDTYASDTNTTRLALRDVVKDALSPEKVEAAVTRVKVLANTTADWNAIRSKLAKSMTKEELRKIEEAYKGPDVLNLPPGENVWRASNAISWIANQVEDASRRIDMERAAGALLVPAGFKEAVIVDEAAA